MSDGTIAAAAVAADATRKMSEVALALCLAYVAQFVYVAICVWAG